MDDALLKHMIDLAFDQVVLVRGDGSIAYANQAAARHLGYTVEEMQQLSIMDIDPKVPCKAAYREMWDLVDKNGPTAFDTLHIHKTGHHIPVEVSASQFLHNGQEYSITIVRNIEKRLALQKDLQEANEIIVRSGTVAFLWANKPHWPVEFVSDNVKALFGYKASDFTSGAILYDRVIHPGDLERVAAEVARASQSPSRAEFAHKPYRIISRQGRVKWVDDQTSIRRDEQGNVTHYQGVVQDCTDRMLAAHELKRLTNELEHRVQVRTEALAKTNQELEMSVKELHRTQKALHENEATLRDLSQKLISRQEEERTRIARDLHDQMGKRLTALALETEWLLRQDPVSKNHVQALSEMIQTTAVELRRVCQGLRPLVLDNMGLAAALRALVKDFVTHSRETGIEADIHDISGLGDTVDITVFRIMQESLTNVRRHARASMVSVSFKQTHLGACLIIEDDGCGFSFKEITFRGDRYGLLGMEERARLCGGQLGIDSEPGQGVRIVFILPQQIQTHTEENP